MASTALIFDFLKTLSRHNDREWFKAHRDQYERALSAVYGITGELLSMVGEYDTESTVGLEPKDCVFRIYRDIRFSPDKSPYKQYFGIYIARGGKSSMRAVTTCTCSRVTARLLREASGERKDPSFTPYGDPLKTTMMYSAASLKEKISGKTFASRRKRSCDGFRRDFPKNRLLSNT